jgi:histidine ammonia-lyase
MTGKSNSPARSPRRLELDGSGLDLPTLRAAAFGRVPIVLSSAARRRMARSRAVVDGILRRGEVRYGINTGFGNFATVTIPGPELEQLQRNLVVSHAAAVGTPLDEPTVRALAILRANCLARGHSGIRPETVERLLEIIDAGILPFVPEQGSVGASGDLAPLAHLACAVIGEGDVFWRGERTPAGEALAAVGLEPLRLGAKEGLSLINGTQATTAIGALALARALDLLRWADLAAALTCDVSLGTDVAFDPRIVDARPHAGATVVAANLRKLLAKSPLHESHRDCGRVQDAYSLRCQPQVHGAVRDQLAFARRAIEIEMNASTDNPMVFAEDGEILSGGNFHGAPVGLPLDAASAAMVVLASMSERRIERLVNPILSELPAFLTPAGGLNSGFMILHVTAASLVSESKGLAHPASVDSIPTSANKEDHVSMSTTAARRFRQIVDNAEVVIAIELLAGCQGLDLRRPLRTSRPLERLHAAVRKVVPFWDRDRVAHRDVDALRAWMRSGGMAEIARIE